MSVLCLVSLAGAGCSYVGQSDSYAKALWHPSYQDAALVEAEQAGAPAAHTALTRLPPLDFPAAAEALEAQSRLARPRQRLSAAFCETKYKLWTDFGDYYAWPNVRDVLLGVAAGSVLANTSLDQDFRDWYQEDFRSPGTNNFSSFWRTFGEGAIFIPSFAGLGLAAAMCGDGPVANTVADFSFRTERAYAVGAPALLFLQNGLGGSRPGENPHNSAWRPFQDDNGVSGHAFIGAVPFLTAAEMVDRPILKGGLYFCSALPAWSRVNDDMHYLSQACLGWWLAYLACRTVERTDCWERQISLVPIATAEMTGMGLVIER